MGILAILTIILGMLVIYRFCHRPHKHIWPQDNEIDRHFLTEHDPDEVERRLKR